MLVTANGQPISSKRRIDVTDPRLAKIAASVDDAFRMMHLTVVCVHCGSGIKAENHPADPTWRMECDCAVRVMANPQRH